MDQEIKFPFMDSSHHFDSDFSLVFYRQSFRPNIPAGERMQNANVLIVNFFLGH